MSMTNQVKRIVHQLICHTPFIGAAIAFAARLPVGFKGSRTARFFGIMLRALQDNGRMSAKPLRTNFGIHTELNLSVPSTVSEVLLFGTPDCYSGERAPLYLSSELSRHSDVFLDIGANYGYFTHFVRAANRDIPIHYFEPNKTLYEIVDNNVKQNDPTNITGHQLAIADRSGTASFYINHTDTSSSSLELFFADKHELEEETVVVTTMDEFVFDHGLTNILAKVDIEAAEFLFLQGATQSLDKLSFLVIEVLGPAIEQGFVSRMIEYGFNAYYINDLTLEHSSDGAFHYVPPEFNWLFCRESIAELESLLKNTRFTVK